MILDTNIQKGMKFTLQNSNKRDFRWEEMLKIIRDPTKPPPGYCVHNILSLTCTCLNMTQKPVQSFDKITVLVALFVLVLN